MDIYGKKQRENCAIKTERNWAIMDGVEYRTVDSILNAEQPQNSEL